MQYCCCIELQSAVHVPTESQGPLMMTRVFWPCSTEEKIGAGGGLIQETENLLHYLSHEKIAVLLPGSRQEVTQQR